MKLAATSGYLNAMAAATYLTHKGVPFRKAHEIIGNIVRFALEKGVELDALSQDDLESFGTDFGSDFRRAISLQATIDCHDVIGGTAAGQVQQALQQARDRAKGRSRSEATSSSEAVDA
jgi:argininosuccinate lyase